MCEVTFWQGGREMTMPDCFETPDAAYEWAREGLRDNPRYDSAIIWVTLGDEYKFVDEVTR